MSGIDKAPHNPVLPPSGDGGSRNVGIPTLPPSKLPPGAGLAPPKKSSVEAIKIESNGLRGRLVEELARDTDHFEEVEKQLVKFHGLYQQNDRDSRDKDYQFVIRSRVPGGKLTAEQYLVHEDLADGFGNGTLRITTRQDFQLHGILKGDLQRTMRILNERLITTLGACGDVVRNVVYPPVPPTKPYHREIERLTLEVADHLTPPRRAYYEIWLDGEHVYDSAKEAHAEEVYGKAFLPRKFKFGFAYPGDNSIDVYTQDVGFIPVIRDEELAGFNVVVGGGLGMTHKKPETFPRLADPLGFVRPEQAKAVAEAILLVQRDHGDRVNRKTARLKYLVHRWGIDRFRLEVEARLGYSLEPPAEIPPLELELYLGWHEQGDGLWYLGLSVENGRIQNTESRHLKSALHELVSRFKPGIGLTTNQDILLTGLREEDRAPIEAILRKYGVALPWELSNARTHAMACPALPTCPLSIAESERVLPGVIDELETELAALGLEDEKLSIRMTGCPNGCARPYVADIGFVGRSLDKYTVFLGGRTDGTRLNKVYRDLVPLGELVAILRPILVLYRDQRAPGEAFGDFCDRIGIETLQNLTEADNVTAL